MRFINAFIFLLTASLFFPGSLFASDEESVSFEVGSRFSLPTIDVDADYNIGGLANLNIPYEVSPSDLPDMVSKGYAAYARVEHSGWELSGDINMAVIDQDVFIPLDIPSLVAALGGGSSINLSGFSAPVTALSASSVDSQIDMEIDNRDFTLAYNLKELKEGLLVRGGVYMINVDVDAAIQINVNTASLLGSLPVSPLSALFPVALLPADISIGLPITFAEEWDVHYIGAEYRHPLSDSLEFRGILDVSVTNDKADKTSLGVRWVPGDNFNFEGGYQLTKYDMEAKDLFTTLTFDGTLDGVYGSVSYRF